MFKTGFQKIAGTMKATISPEEYYDLKSEKDPWAGAVLGAMAGSAAGALKGKKNAKHKAALVGAALGGAAGASTGHLVGKANKALRLSLLRGEVKNLKLKTTPGKSDYHDHKE